MRAADMKVLAVNAGSSSIRLDLFTAGRDGVVRTASHRGAREDAGTVSQLREFLSVAGPGAVQMAVHRVVHGGQRHTRPCLLNPGVEADIEQLAPLAPLHNPQALEWMQACREVLGSDLPQAAVFDTAFFAELPEVAASYALPRELCSRYAIRRYGFHGLAHADLWRQWRKGRPGQARNLRVITLQLGAGCSISAIRDGRPLDTSMGFSPLEGLVMATRSGDIDAGVLLHLQRHGNMTPAQIEQLLNEQSGLRGMSGQGGDMRALLESDAPAARLAIALYCYRARKYLGSYLAVLGGADAIVFGGGVGENAAPVRAAILAGLEWAGIELDAERNSTATPAPGALHAGHSKVEIHALPVDEARILAEEAVRLAGEGSTITTQTGGKHA